MRPLHMLTDDLNRGRMAEAERQRPARRLLAHQKKARRAERRLRNAVRRALRLRTEPES